MGTMLSAFSPGGCCSCCPTEPHSEKLWKRDSCTTQTAYSEIPGPCQDPIKGSEVSEPHSVKGERRGCGGIGASELAQPAQALDSTIRKMSHPLAYESLKVKMSARELTASAGCSVQFLRGQWTGGSRTSVVMNDPPNPRVPAADTIAQLQPRNLSAVAVKSNENARSNKSLSPVR